MGYFNVSSFPNVIRDKRAEKEAKTGLDTFLTQSIPTDRKSTPFRSLG